MVTAHGVKLKSSPAVGTPRTPGGGTSGQKGRSAVRPRDQGVGRRKWREDGALGQGLPGSTAGDFGERAGAQACGAGGSRTQRRSPSLPSEQGPELNQPMPAAAPPPHPAQDATWTRARGGPGTASVAWNSQPRWSPPQTAAPAGAQQTSCLQRPEHAQLVAQQTSCLQRPEWPS